MAAESATELRSAMTRMHRNPPGFAGQPRGLSLLALGCMLGRGVYNL
jgi:hypothetical protein